MNGLFPYAVCTTTVATATTPSASEPDCPPSPSSPAFSEAGAGPNMEQAGSGRSSPSASSSSSAADAFSFSISGQRSPCPSTSTSALCFGAGGAGVRLWSSSKALAVARASKIHGKEEEEDAQQAAASVTLPPKGYAVGRHLRRISRRLRKARGGNRETPAAASWCPVDDTARERAEAVASAIAHCKETLRRGTPRMRGVPLDLSLRDRQDEIIAGAAARRDDECGDARTPLPAAAVFPTALARHAPCMMLPPASGREPAAPAAGPPPSSQISGPVTSREVETRGSFSELEFLETFDGDEEMIDRHFITVQT